MFTSSNVFDLPGRASGIALGIFPDEVERYFVDLDIVRAADVADALARISRAPSGRLIVDSRHAATAIGSRDLATSRLILLATTDCAAGALDAMDAGAEHVFLDGCTRAELAAAITGEMNELGSAQNPRLADLGLKMATIAQEIETLLHAPAQPGPLRHVESAAFLEGGPSAPQVRALIRARHARSNHFPGDLFADPAWDMLLDLMAARLEGKVVSVSSLCIAAVVPPTTALRWIKTMTDGGLMERKADPTDGRRVFIDLTERSMEAMQAYFARSSVASGGMLAA
jgi:hypothetical protein